MTSNPPHHEDLEIAGRALGGDLDAIDELLERMRVIPGFLETLPMGRKGRQMAEGLDDLAQECALLVWRKLATYAGLSTFETWVCGICRFEFRNWLRRRLRNMSLLDDLSEDFDDELIFFSNHDQLLCSQILEYIDTLKPPVPRDLPPEVRQGSDVSRDRGLARSPRELHQLPPPEGDEEAEEGLQEGPRREPQMNQRKRQYRREEDELLRELARQEEQASRRGSSPGLGVDAALPRDPGVRESSKSVPHGDESPANPAEIRRHLEEFQALNRATARAIQQEQAVIEEVTRAARNAPAPPWEETLRQRMIDDTAFLRGPRPRPAQDQAVPILDLPAPAGASWRTHLSRAVAAVAILATGWFVSEAILLSGNEDPTGTGDAVARADSDPRASTLPMAPLTSPLGPEGIQTLGGGGIPETLLIEFDSLKGEVSVESLDGTTLDADEADFYAFLQTQEQARAAEPLGKGVLLSDLKFDLTDLVRNGETELSSGPCVLTIREHGLDSEDPRGFGTVLVEL